jgi:hypothetical protein
MISPSIYPPMFRPCLDGARPYPITRSLAPVVAKYLYACRLLPKIASSASGRVKHRAAAHADAADYPVADRFFGLSFVPRSHGSRADGKVCMSEIWFDFEGNPIDVLPNGVARQVRRVVARGRPQLVYDGEGQPLCLPIAVSSAELRRAVGVDGLYRLYQIDENRRTIDGARAAHVPLRPSPALGRAPWDMPAPAVSAANVPVAPEPRSPLDELATLSRTSLALARQIIACVPVLVHTADTLLRISDDADTAIGTAIRDLMK